MGNHVDKVKEELFDDASVSNQDYGRLIEEADEQDQRDEWTVEAASAHEV